MRKLEQTLLLPFSKHGNNGNSTLSKAYWNHESVQREALERVGRTFGVKELDDWYSISAPRVYSELSFIKKHYNGSLLNALKHLYPQHNWKFHRFSRVPSGTWNDHNSQREALERLGREKFGVKELDDWYSIAAPSVYNELSFIKSHYNGSLFNALKTLFPHHNWNSLRVSRVPAGYWSDESAQRDALDRLGTEYGVKELDDWYSVPPTAHHQLTFIKDYYNGSLYNALQKLYPQHNWDRLRFSTSTEKAHRDALKRFGKRLGVKDLDDWYGVSSRTAYREVGFIILKYGSLFHTLKKFYPQHDWDPLRFRRLPQKFWQQPDTVQYYQKMFIKWKNENNIRTVSDWYQLAPQQVQLFKRASKGIFGSTMKMLESWFPDIIWQSQSTAQLELQSLLKHVIVDSIYNYRKRGNFTQKQIQYESLEQVLKQQISQLSQAFR